MTTSPSREYGKRLAKSLDHFYPSRLFAGPNQYPPDDFAAYGILAFPEQASTYDVSRHMMFCEAYVSFLPNSLELASPVSDQMVTIWPVKTAAKASELNRIPTELGSTPSKRGLMPSKKVCENAVSDYDLVSALIALGDAKLAGANISGRGPFLLAWSPSENKGKPDALVLMSDLSEVTTYEQAEDIFLEWKKDIEADPDLWEKGWNTSKIKLTIRLWADKYGPKMLKVFGIKE